MRKESGEKVGRRVEGERQRAQNKEEVEERREVELYAEKEERGKERNGNK